MVHYLNSTCESMSNGPDLSVWSNSIPEEAVRFEFLMDGILALSSLHLTFESSGQFRRYNELALYYQNTGLWRYADALKHITVDNSHALFGYAIITTVMALAVPRLHQRIDVPDYRESLISMFELLQGVRIISKASGDSLRTGHFGTLFRDILLEIERPRPAPDVQDAMNALREQAITVARYVQPEKRGIYISSIDILEWVFGSMATSSHLGPIMAWPAMINEKLVEFFKQSDPMAQLIFLHYGVLLLYIHNRWWGRDFGLRLIEDLTASISAVSPAWAVCTSWDKDRAALVV